MDKMSYLRFMLSKIYRFQRFENFVELLDEDQYRITLLGCENSGKSAILQQIPLIDQTYTDLQRLVFKENISNMILERLIEILRDMKHSGVQLLEQTTQEISEEFEASLLGKGKGHDQLFQLASIIRLFWDDRNLQNYLNENNVDKSVECFLNKLETISLKDYVPTDDDINNYLFNNIHRMKSKKPIKEIKFVNYGVTRNIAVINQELLPDREVIELLNNSKGVIFCVSIADYDVVSEDGINAIIKAKNSFSSFLSMLNSDKYQVLLIFTKKDLFLEKLKTVPLGNYLPDYEGNNDYQGAYKFILNMFYQEPLAKRWKRNETLTNLGICTFNRKEIRSILWWINFRDQRLDKEQLLKTYYAQWNN